MNRRYIIIFIIIMVLASLTAVSAAENTTADTELSASENQDILDETYSEDDDPQSKNFDDIVTTHNVVKYYGDKDTKFEVSVYDSNNTPKKDVNIQFGRVMGKTLEKTTNSNGKAYFPINYNLGKHTVRVFIINEDNSGYWTVDKTVKIKSTIILKEMVKFSGEKKKFKIQFLDSKGNKLVKKIVKIKMKGKTHKLRTDKNGYVKIKSNFKSGTSKITIINPKTGQERETRVKVLEKGVHKASVKIVENADACPFKKLKNGDKLDTLYDTGEDSSYTGVSLMASYGNNPAGAHHTKLMKAKFFFKNKKTGKIITKTSKKVKDNIIKVKPVKGYTPFKVNVWYKDKR